MTHTVTAGDRKITYELTRKKVKNILTFNVHLMEYPLPAAEYVVAHEFTHFLQANHSARFYEELARYMPDYKQRERILK